MVTIYEYKNNTYINLTNRCTNKCVFCDKKRLQKVVNAPLELEEEPTAEDIVFELEKIKPKGEIVFCGVGEPLLKINTILEICRHAKEKGLKTRLNTNGQAALIHPDRNVALELKEAGLESVSVSLNATGREEYYKKCRPLSYMKKKYNIYKQVMNFAKACKKNKIKTTLTFVDYKLNKEGCQNLAQKLGLKFKVRPCLG